MKCIRCGHDSQYKERTNQTCPQCKGFFAFEPRQGAKLTDQAFQNAIERVSGGGKLRWGAEHLYYEVCRRLRPRFPRFRGRPSLSCGCIFIVLVWIVGLSLVIGVYSRTVMNLLPYVLGIPGVIAVVMGLLWLRRWRRSTVPLDEGQFQAMLTTWTRTHGKPPGLIERPAAAATRRPSRALSYEMIDYSFDRAVICDRARTVDLLLANNFHFENNCAVLTVGGYPRGPFETVRTMLKRNPKLQVFALHDATPDGCTLARRLASDPAWFAGQVPVIDVGLRPSHAAPFKGLWLPASVPFVAAEQGIKPAEAEWLTKYALELAAIRPDQVLKRLFRAMNRPTDDDDDGVYVDGSSSGGSDGGDNWVIEDQDSFGADASADDGGADSFG